MPYKNIEKSSELKMKKAVETLTTELRGIRTGRASAALLEGVRVNCYGSFMPINQLANISIPQPRMIEIRVWDDSSIKPIEKAIADSGLGLNPNTEGKAIRLNIPSLNAERREEIIKRMHSIVEEFKIEIRNVRRDANEDLKKLKKDSEITEDESFKSIEKIQKITDLYMEQVNHLLAKKEKEIREE